MKKEKIESYKDVGFAIDPNNNINLNPDNLEKVKTLLNSKGPGFCLAKWQQVTLHLGAGTTHSCHHPTPHKIPLKELENNPSALHNTKFKKEQRKIMLEGGKPSECDFCWRIEKDNGNSDRFLKSIEPWALPYYNEIINYSGDENIEPTHLEVDFSNICNQQCIYCGPEYSSTWVKDLKENGPIKLFEDTKLSHLGQGYQDLDSIVYKNKKDNPYIDAYWKWVPTIYDNLKVYRITGGEPLMSKETFRTMDWLYENPNRNLEFCINSNFSVPNELWNKFIKKLKKIKSNKVKKITIYTSIEGWGERAEYSRRHMNFKLLQQRVEEIALLGNVRCVMMCTFNIFSITSFQQFLEWVLELKCKYNPNKHMTTVENDTGYVFKEHYQRTNNKNSDQAVIIGIDIPYLRHPQFLDAQYCTEDLVEKYLLPMTDWMSRNIQNPTYTCHQGFETYEFEKMKRITFQRIYFNKQKELQRDTDKGILINRAKFYQFITQIDKRWDTNFLKVYPEMNNFYNTCKAANNTVLSDINRFTEFNK